MTAWHWLLPAGAFLLYLPFGTWLWYAAAANFDRAQAENRLPVEMVPAARFFYGVAALHSMALRWTWMLLVFLYVSRDLTTTKMLNRLVDGDSGWRRDRALRVRALFLNYLDRRGVHT